MQHDLIHFIEHRWKVLVVGQSGFPRGSLSAISPEPGWNMLGAYLFNCTGSSRPHGGLAMVVSADCLLVSCPRCGAWPMAAKGHSDSWSAAQVRFKCRQCENEEVLSVEGTKTPYREAPPTQPR
jgi:hypothetical protein